MNVTLASIFLTFFLFKIVARLSMISQENTRNLQRAFGAEGRIKDQSSQIRSLKYQINSHNCNDVLNKNKNI
jgi:hypothetical protein